MTNNDEVRDAPEAIDELEAEMLADIARQAETARRQAWYVDAAPADRETLERAMADVVEHARLMLDSLRVRVGIIGLH